MVEHTEGEKKLSQLLGEYMEEKKKNPEGFLDISTALMAGFKATDAYIISKQFGFIEWLVQNDKINKRKVEVRPFCDDRTEREFPNHIYEMVLMLLSIQDEPVKFLSEILKDE